MTPLNQRRLANFKANKRGYYSLWIFIGIFSITLCAEFIANDKPIVFSKDGSLYFPVFFTYSEAELGGALETEADYRDPFVESLIENNGWSIWPPLRYSYNTIDWDLQPPYPHPPTAEHWLGTDGGSTDIVAKLLYGFRLSVLFGITLTIIASTIGVTVGALQGYFGGLVDLLGQRVVEIWAGLPVLLILIILASIVEPNVFWLLGILTLFSWMALVGVVRAEFLRARNFEFVRAARSLGVGNATIIVKHVLPNAMVATLTYLPFILNGSITMLTALDFLGFGLPLDSPSLGRLLSAAKANLEAPWLGISVFTTLATMLILLIFIGEAVRDALDPRRTLGIASEDAVPDTGKATTPKGSTAGEPLPAG
ncbi:MAG: ABC transporter permease [Gammaproteobacteria bacterium]|nr:ABC transporter permease [Gammaproteobacteria bacterium]MBS04072.1 ABC transporter permease [Gammaproteobacteria bacterium]|tara:strand:- start:2045 stop:3148 length:1104 start_codon:yes stop_codon:yes gene_type:complete